MAEFMLPKKKVLIKPIIKEGGRFEKGHSGAWQLDDTVFSLVAPIDSTSGRIKEILNEEERAFFENPAKSGLDFKPGDLLSSKQKDNFWVNYNVRLTKPKSVIDENTVLLTLNLEKPDDYLKYKLLMANTARSGGLVAPSWNERYQSGEYKVVIVDEQQTEESYLSQVDKVKEAYLFFSSIENSSDKMFDFLSVYWLENKTYSQPPANAKREFYRKEIAKLIDTNLGSFLSIARDKENYPFKLLITRGVKAGVITYNRQSGYEITGGAFMGNTFKQAIDFLKDDRYQQELVRLESLINA